ncbi:pentapeptide repeat-containing protein [Rhizobium herbae]|uniref:Pentapeptide repeat-containing protein n=1 Tax=Rhizobium herbae TaxID=508661 RepID=A0ABS4EUU7_9HYPH|nr:pentapeptide repeat-containing protein [Rhizobium herbae]MBP1861561.1 hypothetical protein [Rhizobium herbae]
MTDPNIDPSQAASVSTLETIAHSDDTALESRLNRIEAEIMKSRIDHEAALMGQEHRLVASVKNLSEVIFMRSGDERWRLLSPALTAFVWCLVPSGGTAAVGLVAILTLLVTFQQSRLLAIQNDKVEIQNLLAEAQRRASLVVEITAIFEQIDKEKQATERTADNYCSDTRKRSCFRQPVAEEPQPVFVPSQATLGRIAALTQALRPYRYLTVEGAEPGQCPQDTASPALSEAYNSLLGNMIGRGPRGSHDGVPADSAKTLIAGVYANHPLGTRKASDGLLAAFAHWVDMLSGTSLSTAAQLNCAPASPERGQLLVSLHAAGVDLSAIQTAGGDFTYSDIPGAFLSGIRLNEVNLTGSRLPGASFTGSDLTAVTFRNADLTNVRFSNASIRKSDFEGARIQVYNRDGDAPLFFIPRLSDDNLLSGIRLYQKAGHPNIFARVCGTLKLASDVATPNQGPTLADNASSYGLLIETVTESESVKRQEAVLIFDLKTGTQSLYGDPSTTQLEYLPFKECPV